MSSILGLLGGVVNANLTDVYNQRNAERNQQYWEQQAKTTFGYNEKAAENADKRTRKLYTDLQSPKAIVEQLKTAGLNPALMYSNSGMGGHISQGAQGGMNGAPGAPNALGLQTFIDPLTMAQIKNINADTDKKKEETKNVTQDTALKKSNELLNNQTLDQRGQTFAHELGILIANEAIQENEVKMLETKNQITNKQLEILENQALLAKYEEELQRRFRDKGWDLGSMTGLGSLFIQMGDKLLDFLKKWDIELPEWMTLK